jgi:hypothetical protein
MPNFTNFKEYGVICFVKIVGLSSFYIVIRFSLTFRRKNTNKFNNLRHHQSVWYIPMLTKRKDENQGDLYTCNLKIHEHQLLWSPNRHLDILKTSFTCRFDISRRTLNNTLYVKFGLPLIFYWTCMLVANEQLIFMRNPAIVIFIFQTHARPVVLLE